MAYAPSGLRMPIVEINTNGSVGSEAVTYSSVKQSTCTCTRVVVPFVESLLKPYGEVIHNRTSFSPDDTSLPETLGHRFQDITDRVSPFLQRAKKKHWAHSHCFFLAA